MKKLYGGDAKNKSQLSTGDTLSIALLEEAVCLLLRRTRNIDFFSFSYEEKFEQPFEIRLPINQLRNLRMKDCSLLFYRFFAQVPLHIYPNNDLIQETRVISGTKQINIYTRKE